MLQFRGLKKIFLDVFIVFIVVITVIFVYRTYWLDIKNLLFGEQLSTMYVRSVPLAVSVADNSLEYQQGLSGVKDLGDFEGKLFVFPKEGYYSMWMKDMLFPIDIIWINDGLKVVHTEENVTPDTFPDSFTSDEPARFVLEVNAFFVESEKIQEGDDVIVPPSALPGDLVEILQ